MNNIEHKLQSVLDKAVDNRKVFGTSFCVKYKEFSWCGTSGNFQKDDQYFIASTTKLFITALILNFRYKGIISLADKISKYLSEEVVKGLNVFNGKDYSNELTIKNLLAHTSGISDYFQGIGANGKSLEKELMSGNDQFWTFEQAIDLSKNKEPLFIPNQKRKARYSDTNFQLLGRIVENITKKSVSENLNELIFSQLSLQGTYLFEDINDKQPNRLYFKNKALIIPKAMTSFGPDGAIVSTSKEMLQFIQAFFSAKFFPGSYINELKEWNSIFFPIQSGIGIHRFKLPWIFNPFGSIPELIGHSGLSGALAFACPEKEIFVAGTVNQVAHPDISFKVMVKLIQQLKT